MPLFDDSEALEVEVTDYVLPRRATPSLRVVSDDEVVDADPLWPGCPAPALRPRAHERCLAVEYGTEACPTILSGVWYVRITDETLDPGWWRARLPDNVDFRIVEHPCGVDSPEGMRAARVVGVYPAGREDVSPVLVTAPEKVVLHTPRGPVLATLSRVRREDGHPLYYPAPVHWMRIEAAIKGAVDVAKAAVGVVRSVVRR